MIVGKENILLKEVAELMMNSVLLELKYKSLFGF